MFGLWYLFLNELYELFLCLFWFVVEVMIVIVIGIVCNLEDVSVMFEGVGDNEVWWELEVVLRVDKFKWVICSIIFWVYVEES